MKSRSTSRSRTDGVDFRRRKVGTSECAGRQFCETCLRRVALRVVTTAKGCASRGLTPKALQNRARGRRSSGAPRVGVPRNIKRCKRFRDFRLLTFGLRRVSCDVGFPRTRLPFAMQVPAADRCDLVPAIRRMSWVRSPRRKVSLLGRKESSDRPCRATGAAGLDTGGPSSPSPTDRPPRRQPAAWGSEAQPTSRYEANVLTRMSPRAPSRAARSTAIPPAQRLAPQHDRLFVGSGPLGDQPTSSSRVVEQPRDGRRPFAPSVTAVIEEQHRRRTVLAQPGRQRQHDGSGCRHYRGRSRSRTAAVGIRRAASRAAANHRPNGTSNLRTACSRAASCLEETSPAKGKRTRREHEPS